MNQKQQFDVFLSFRNRDEDGSITQDSILAEKLYRELNKKEISTFFSNITLMELGESVYKKSIDEALDSASILIVISTNISYIKSRWVQYEWESFNNDMLEEIKENAEIFTYTENILPSDLPRTLRGYQNYQISSVSVKDVAIIIEKIIERTQQISMQEKKDICTVEPTRNLLSKQRQHSVYSSTYGEEFNRLKVQAESTFKADMTVINHLREVTNDDKKWSVLDVGCAYGFVAASRFGENDMFNNVLCVDNNEKVIEKSSELHTNGKIKFEVLDVEGSEFENQLHGLLETNGLVLLDMVFCALTLHHLKDPGRFLRRVRKFIRKGGYIFLRGSDDGSKISFPDSYIMDKIIHKSLHAVGVSDRLNGRKFHTQLVDSGYDQVRLFTFMKDLSHMDFDQREALFKESFAYRIDYFKKQYEKSPTDINAKNDYEWMVQALELLEEKFFEKSFWYAEYDYIGIGKK